MACVRLCRRTFPPGPQLEACLDDCMAGYDEGSGAAAECGDMLVEEAWGGDLGPPPCGLDDPKEQHRRRSQHRRRERYIDDRSDLYRDGVRKTWSLIDTYGPKASELTAIYPYTVGDV